MATTINVKVQYYYQLGWK